VDEAPWPADLNDVEMRIRIVEPLSELWVKHTHRAGAPRTHPIEPSLDQLNLRVAFFAVPRDGAPDGLRVSLKLEHRTSVVKTRGQRLSKTRHGSSLKSN
jgi:hypothetical protein